MDRIEVLSAGADSDSTFVAGTYFGLVEEIHDDSADGSRIVRLDYVGVDGDLLTESGPRREFVTATRRRWRAATSLSDLDAAERLDAASALVRDLDALNVDIAELRINDDAVEEFLSWLEQESWLRFEVDAEGSPVGFAAVEQRVARQLRHCFSSDNWYSATAAMVAAAIDGMAQIERALFHDVGQAAAVSLYSDGMDRPAGYFDVGLPFGPNKGTRPSSVGLCLCDDAPVILSHWDKDHWGAVDDYPELYSRTWIVPRQAVGATHAKAAANIALRGRLLVVKRSSRPKRFSTHEEQVLILHHGSGRTRNDSGLILMIDSWLHDACWVLPGDASYSSFPSPPSQTTVLQATHHGGSFGPTTTAAPAAPSGYGRLVYSFGPQNTYNHPTPASVAHHKVSGWGVHRRQVRKTGGQTRGAVLVGWDSSVAVPAHMKVNHEKRIVR